MLLTACGAIEFQSDLVKPAVTGRAYVAGVGDTVLDLQQTQSLPNTFGRADIFGRMRDAGRVTVRFVGLDGNQAVFTRQDVIIQSNETTLNRAGGGLGHRRYLGDRLVGPARHAVLSPSDRANAACGTDRRIGADRRPPVERASRRRRGHRVFGGLSP
jgi:hypothetical protein